MSKNFSSRRIAYEQSQNKNNFSRNSSNFGSKNPKKIFLPILFVFFMIFISIFNVVKNVGNTIIEPKNYNIESGTTVSTFNELQKIWIDNWKYRLYSKFFAPEIDLKAGYYVVENSMTLENLLKEWFKKTSPTSNEIQITLLPGWNIWDYDNYFAEKNILEKGDFVATANKNFAKYQEKYDFLKNAKSLEWFLMPDTYRIFVNSSADNIIEKLLSGFKNKIASDYNSVSPDLAYQTLILASIVEREERNSKNRPIVAGILAKRVKEGIAMGADATVCYGFQKTFAECTPSFIASVIADHSNIYNTRKNLGYTPTPISSVSVSAWNSAFNPEKSNYYYYLHDNDGIIHYATTLAEHNANVQKYLR